MESKRIALWSCAALLLSSNLMKAQENPKPPAAKKISKVTEIHGYKETDDYFWLREKSKPEVMEYLKAEAAYADAMTADQQGFRDALYKEMLSRIKETDVEVPYKKGNYLYYTRTIKGQQYPLFCRKLHSLRGKEEITLDVNALAKGKKFFNVSAY